VPTLHGSASSKHCCTRRLRPRLMPPRRSLRDRYQLRIGVEGPRPIPRTVLRIGLCSQLVGFIKISSAKC
jgi:hypothetical protein